MNKPNKSPKLKVSFIIDAPDLGAFVHQYADKVHGLEIAAVTNVPHDKNAPRRNGGLKAAIVAALADGPLDMNGIVAKCPQFESKQVKQSVYRLVTVKELLNDKKTGELRTPPPVPAET